LQDTFLAREEFSGDGVVGSEKELRWFSGKNELVLFFLLLFFLLFKPGLRVTWVRVNSGPVVVDRFYICIGLDGYLDNPCILIVK
jgi:hypothetical protein